MVAVMLLVPMMAQALQSLEDTRIARPAPTSEEPSGCPLTASKVMQSIRKTTDGGLAGLKSSIAALKTAIEKKDTEMAKAIERKDTETALEISGLRTDMKDGFSNMSSSINSLDRKLTDKKDGEFSKTNAKIDSIDSAILWMTIAIIAAIAALGLLVFFRTGQTNRLVKCVKKIDPETIVMEDVRGKHVVYTPPIIDNMYVMPFVPPTVTKVAADPTRIAKRSKDIGEVRSSARQSIGRYIEKLSAGTPFTTPQEQNQKALMEKLIADGNIVIS